MKIDPQIHSVLNGVLKNALTAINQTFLHARILGNWGFEGLEKKDYAASIKEMKHADRIMERILFLEGLPNLQDLGKLHIGENVPEILHCDLELATACRGGLVQAIEVCERLADYISREHLEHLLDYEEERIDWLETQLKLVQDLGLENYLQSAMQGESS